MSPKWALLGDNGGAHGTTPVKPIDPAPNSKCRQYPNGVGFTLDAWHTKHKRLRHTYLDKGIILYDVLGIVFIFFFFYRTAALPSRIHVLVRHMKYFWS